MWTHPALPKRAIDARKLYGRLHSLVHKKGGSRESYGRSVVEDDYAFGELIEKGISGFLCCSSDEMSHRGSELAFNDTRRLRMTEAARRRLEQTFADPAACWAAWTRLLDAC